MKIKGKSKNWKKTSKDFNKIKRKQNLNYRKAHKDKLNLYFQKKLIIRNL